MSYLSIEFSVLFPLFFLLYWLFHRKPLLQNILLLIASYSIVASFSVNFLTILIGYTFILYALSFPIFYAKRNHTWLAIAILIAIGNLCFFKYFDFFRTEIQNLINSLGLDYALPCVEIILPIGISFYTFHSINYLVSLQKREISIPSALDFALFLAFFPSIIAGPINRAKIFLPQIQVTTPRTLGNYNLAFILIISALIKVLCLNTALEQNIVNPVFETPSNYHSLDLILANYAYALQIYFNFSGYTDLVTAIALLLGFNLPQNFNMPYFAHNLRDFWQRWHISLSTWIRDYIYIPLGGSKKSFTRTQVNLTVAMLASGLWHGASYTFIIWGGIHALGVVAINIGDKLWGKERLTQVSPFLARFITFQYVCLAWIFFRCPTLTDTYDFFLALNHNFNHTSINFNSLVYLPALLILFIIYPYLAKLPTNAVRLLDKIHWSVLPFVWTLILFLVLATAPSGIPNFIYSNF